jgi:hypothetical protein
MLLDSQKNKQSITAKESSDNTEFPIQSEQLDDKAYTESFDDVMTICPRPGMTPQQRYEFRKQNRPSLAKPNN